MIQLYENLFDNEQINQIWSYLEMSNWKFWHKSYPKSSNYFWKMNLDDNSFFKENLFNVIKQIIGNNFSIENVYANGQSFGMDGDFHTDTTSEKGYTFLYYPMKEWNLLWGGETLIINPDNKQINYFHPIPNGALLFPGTWVHCGRGPSKNYNDLRISIAYKLIKHD